ncbi:hypothetical protein [Pseudochelatococcus sp. G4_1912]|uniref:hypothetical protein n=1 Tax=Pseudochelatococcus sp. G4_1912 TaxID=3114288 RepID=UPI0039C6BE71
MTKTKAGSSEKTSSNAEMRRKAAMEDRLDEELAETFPASDAPTVTRAGAGQDPDAEQKQDKKPAKSRG